MPLRKTEEQEQIALIEWARWQEHQKPELALLYHCPNGGSRRLLEAKKLKAMGVKPGVFDLFLAVPRGSLHGLYIEMKSTGGKPTAAQRQFHWRVQRQGYRAVYAYGFEEARKEILLYLQQETPS